MSSMQNPTLVQRVAKLFGRGKREQEKGETDISEIAEQIYGLEGSPLQGLLIEQNVWKIAKAGDDESELLEYAINALAETSFYAPLEILFEQSEGGAEKIRKLSPEQIIGLADYIVNKSFPDYASIMSLLVGVSGAGPMRDGIKTKIKQMVIDADFYRRQPVTAMQHALMIDDPEAIGAVFAHLRYEVSRSSDNKEVKELEGRLTDVERLKGVSHLNAVSQSDEEREAAYSEWAELNGRVREGLYEMVRQGSTNPEKAFEIAGDIFLVGDYKHAMECFIASRNPEKILEAVKKANDVVMKESGQMYEAADAAYEGIKAILTCDDIDKKIKQQAAEELKRTFSSVHIYNHNIMQAIEAAEISGDFNILRENFLQICEGSIWH